MSLTLQYAFDRYTELTDDLLRERSQAPREGLFRLIRDSNRSIRESVVTLEDTAAFNELVAATRIAFHPQPTRPDHSVWEHAVKNFFRRSGLYTAAAAGSAVDKGETFAQYTSAFRSTERAVTYLAPIEHVEFAAECLDLGPFHIRRFTRADLERMFQVDINRIFYQWALTDIGVLDDYWYVTIKKTIERKDPGHIPINLADIDKVTPTFARYPEISEALLPLICFPWREDLCVPFVIVVDDDLLKTPRSRPAVDQLYREPAFDPTTGDEMDTDRPMTWISLDEKETGECEVMIRSIAERIHQLGPYTAPWQFFGRAGHYFLKGFFSEGFEQLLWHVTTVDALLGDNAGGGATRRLVGRVSAILGTTTATETEIRKRFEELYNFRSKFAHGAAVEKQALRDHLRDAQEIARALLVWFLDFLTHTQEVVCREGLEVPPREVLLKMIDLDSKAKSELQATLKITQTLPEGFPVVPDWLANGGR